MSRADTLSTADLPPPSGRSIPRSCRGDGWNALADIEVFVFAVEAELEAMDRERAGVHRGGRKPYLAMRRRLIGLIWTLIFGGMQWRIASWLSGIPFTTLHSTFARWTRLELWRRLGQRLAFDWRLACGGEVLPSAVVADSRSLRSAPSAWARGIDGGKLVKGVKALAICDKLVLCSSWSCSRQHRRPRERPADAAAAGCTRLPGRLAGRQRVQGRALRRAALAHDIRVSVSPGGTRDGRFLSNGIRWVVERLLAWLSRYRRSILCTTAPWIPSRRTFGSP
jgi:hypothetical protein